MKTCSVIGCDNQGGRTAHNFCDKHYKRYIRHGDPEKALTGYNRRCSVADCEQEPFYRMKTAEPLCPKHYQRLKRVGSVSDDAVKTYRGNTFVDGKGYIHMWHNGKSKMQHRYVMEQFLGRELEKFENVHHINGNRQDNRIENLELWVTMQPTGQRAKDLVKWAKEILAKYNDQKIVGG